MRLDSYEKSTAAQRLSQSPSKYKRGAETTTAQNTTTPHAPAFPGISAAAPTAVGAPPASLNQYGFTLR